MFDETPEDYFQTDEHYDCMRYIQKKYPHGVKIFEKDGKMKNIKYLKKVSCSFKSPNGLILSQWTNENRRFQWKIKIPHGSVGEIWLPNSNEFNQIKINNEKMDLMKNNVNLNFNDALRKIVIKDNLINELIFKEKKKKFIRMI